MSQLNAPITADAFVLEDAPTAARGTYNWVWIGRSSAAATRDFTYLKFDLSSLPPRSIITSATLNLYCYNGANDWSASIPAGVRRCASSWVESTVSWNTKPASTGNACPNATVSSTNYATYVPFNVTTLVQSITDGATDYGFNVFQNSTTTNTRKEFYTREYSSGAYKPFLLINYTANGVAYINTGSSWVLGFPYVNTGSAWARVYAHINTGSAWVTAKE